MRKKASNPQPSKQTNKPKRPLALPASKNQDVFADAKIQTGLIKVDGHTQYITLPKGCLGVLLVFKSQEDAKDWGAKNILTLEIERRKNVTTTNKKKNKKN